MILCRLWATQHQSCADFRRYLINTGTFKTFLSFCILILFLSVLSSCHLYESARERRKPTSQRYHERSNEETPKVRSVFYHLHERMLFAAFTRKEAKKRTTIGGEFNYQKHWILDVFLAHICIITDGKSGNNRHKIDGFVFFFFNPNSFFEMLRFFLLNSAICGVFFHFGSSIFLVFLLSSSGSLSFISIIHSFRTRRLP